MILISNRAIPYVDMLLAIIFGVYLNEFIVQKFNIDTLGQYFSGLTLGGFVAIVANLGFVFQIQRNLIRRGLNFRQVLTAYYLCYLTISFGAVTLLLWVTNQTVAQSVLVALLLAFKGNIYGWELMQHRNKHILLGNLVLRATLIYVFLVNGYSDINFFLSFYCLLIITVTMPLMYSGQYLIMPILNRRTFWNRFHRSLKILPLPLVELWQVRGDILMISLMFSSETVGRFSLVYMCYFAMLLFPLVLSKQLFLSLTEIERFSDIINKNFFLYILLLIIFAVVAQFVDYEFLFMTFGLSALKSVILEIKVITLFLPIVAINYLLRYYLQAHAMFAELTTLLMCSSIAKIVYLLLAYLINVQIIYAIAFGEVILFIGLCYVLNRCHRL